MNGILNLNELRTLSVEIHANTCFTHSNVVINEVLFWDLAENCNL